MGRASAIEQGEPSAILFDGGAFYPSVSIEMLHDDNIFLQSSGEQSSYLTAVTPRVRVDLEGEASQIAASAEVEAGRYYSSQDDDYVDTRVKLEGGWFPTERVTLYASAGYRREHEARGSGGTALAPMAFAHPDRLHIWELTGRFGYGLEEVGAPRFELEYNRANRRYDNNRSATVFQDRTSDQLKGTFFYKIAPNTSLLLEGTATELDYDVANLDSLQYRMLAGLTWDATYQSEGFLKMGWGKKNFDSTAIADASAASWEIGFNWTPLSYSSVTVSTSRDFGESDGGSTGSYSDIRQYGIAWNHDWYSFLGTRLEYNTGTTKYGSTTREDDITEISLRADYRVQPWLLFGAGITHSKRDSNTAGLDYSDNVIGLQMGVNM